MTSPVRAARTAPRRALPAPAPERSRRADLRVVAEPRRRPRTAAIVATCSVVLFASLLASAVLHSVLVTGQARLDQLDKAIETERTDLAHAKLRLADSKSPARIAQAAASLGMVPAGQQTWISQDDPTLAVVTGAPPTTATTTPADDGSSSTDSTGTTDQADTTDSTATDSTATGGAQ